MTDRGCHASTPNPTSNRTKTVPIATRLELPTTHRLLNLTPTVLPSRASVEACLEQVNRSSPAARRRMTGWNGRDASMRFASVSLGPLEEADSSRTFMVEAQSSFGMEVLTLDPKQAPSDYSILMPLAGSVQLRLASGQVQADAGQGLVINPADVELTRLSPGTHFIEFNLPKAPMLRLAAELAPGLAGDAPRFEPLLGAELSRRLLSMSLHAATALQTQALRPQARVMFKRWREMLALTLLHEHTGPTDASDAPEALPVTLQRALEYIDAYASSDIVLLDIATAACCSVSSLLRLFQARLGLSPGLFLRQVRLDRARADLQNGRFGTVREVAEHWGFVSPSKFSQAYAKRFGELPSRTRMGGL